MNIIREYAKQVGHEIHGKLTREREWEYELDSVTFEKKYTGSRHYSDQGGNEYIISKKGICIVTKEGAVI